MKIQPGYPDGENSVIDAKNKQRAVEREMVQVLLTGYVERIAQPCRTAVAGFKWKNLSL